MRRRTQLLCVYTQTQHAQQQRRHMYRFVAAVHDSAWWRKQVSSIPLCCVCCLPYGPASALMPERVQRCVRMIYRTHYVVRASELKRVLNGGLACDFMSALACPKPCAFLWFFTETDSRTCAYAVAVCVCGCAECVCSGSTCCEHSAHARAHKHAYTDT